MLKSPTGKVIVLLAALVLVIGIALHFSGGKPKLPAPTGEQPDVSSPAPTPSVAHQTTALTPDTPAEEAIGPAGFPKLPREKVEEYLQRNKRNVQSLLAAFHALGDTNYLREAATNFPNDPQLQWTILANKAFPEERRKWLDAFKESSPDNSLASYLSAADHFKNHQPDAAVKDLLAASGKADFKNYAMEARLGEEELNRAAGRSMLESVHVAGWANDLLGELGELKGISTGIVGLRQQYASAGDTASAEHLVQAGMALADRFETGDGGKFLIGQMVGNAIERTMLNQLDANTAYEFLGGQTPAQRAEELSRQRANFKELAQALQGIYFNLNETEMVTFTDRMKIYGEAEALRWLQQQKKPAPAGGN